MKDGRHCTTCKAATPSGNAGERLALVTGRAGPNPDKQKRPRQRPDEDGRDRPAKDRAGPDAPFRRKRRELQIRTPPYDSCRGGKGKPTVRSGIEREEHRRPVI